MKHKINITFDCITPQRIQVSMIIRSCVESALEAENVNVPCEINVLITNDKGIHAINLASRQIDKPTDVLSFPMFNLEPGVAIKDAAELVDPETGLCPLGDMAISLQRASSQAKEFGHSLRREVGYLTIHSVLHLLGYDHIDEGPLKAQMRAREEYIASQIARMQRV